MKARAALLALVIAVAVGVGESQATVTAVGLTLSESSSSAAVSGSTLYYAPSSSGSFTVTATASSSSSITSVDFPLITGMTGGGSVASPGPYQDSYDWTSSTVTSGLQTVTAYDGDPSNMTAQFTVKPDTVPTVSNVAPTENSGTGDQYWSSSANTLWFRPAGAGSFTLKATAASSGSGITQVAFPDVSGVTGWTGSTGGADTSSSYASPVAYTWTAGAAPPGAKEVTATTATGLTGSATITIGADTTAPTGQTVALSGGPWYASLSVPLTLGAGTDVGAGIDASRGIVQRASATLANGACGTFGPFAAVTLSSGADTGVASGNCYRYQYQATDNVGNVSTASATSTDAKVDTTPPTTPTLLVAGFAGSAASGNVIYYRPGGSGRFTVNAAAADGESGIASYAFPSAAGFTVTGSGASRTYSFSSAPGTPPAGLTVSATNGAGLTSSAASFTLVPDSTPPTVTIRCNGGSCLPTPYAKAVTVSLAATDGVGSGLNTIRYSTDGTDPTPDRGVEYTGPFTVSTLTLLKVRAYDRAGNWSSPLAVTVRSLADKLVLSAPLRLSVKSGARYLYARVTSTRRAMASATMTGPNLKQPKRWRFILGAGTSIVQLKLPAGLARTGRYRVVWRVQAGTQKTTKTTVVTLRPR